ncbi:host specificity protein [Tabrizicola sp. TH137]|uniref:baseplate multidomain protein megatron n=1 Tax=Tabrizicola sp. TH137 TaxID=2067452 RepID=UPI000C7D69B5|nr:glycoside hydrolase/phage tail family protein [Tabrizicola sp. TH137]PLL13156.1 host specificity protein [Tabrizicola sp. TH137]
MATLILGAAGAFIGSGFGGTVLGLSGAVIGRAVGATIGRAIDSRLMGAGSEAVSVETARLDRLRVMISGEGGALPVVWGRMRVGGQVIWCSPFTEHVTHSQSQSQSQTRGGKGGSRSTTTTTTVTSYSYSVNLAVALCEGVIQGVGRIWADGTEVNPATVTLRVYPGDEVQLPDPKISALEGDEQAPAYRGTAYVVFEDLMLEAYGNRVPQFTFEVLREAQGELAAQVAPFARAVRAVALIPGTGEYALATERVLLSGGGGGVTVANQHSAAGPCDMAVSLAQMRRELPDLGAVSVVVSWFGDDLRCGQCKVKPKVETRGHDGTRMPWRAGGISRAEAEVLAQEAGKSIYGGTPADGAVIEAIRAIRAGGQAVMFYPFLLMEQLAGNALPDPYSGALGQPVRPWRGRITLSVAPGRAGSPDGTAAAVAQVAACFGQAMPGHFTREGGAVIYSGPPDDWGLRRMILHYAHLCVLAGGVEAFCIGSELRGLTQIRGPGHSFPAVAALATLAGEVRAILGPGAKISYAADWSEYSGFARDGNRYFHLDDLWAHPAVDFIGIDNYMPLSDWREGEERADADWPGVHDLGYLRANVAGGEGFDWYYASDEGVAAQRREPITDGEHGEPWIWRVKDLKSWWSLPHHPRIDGVRLEQATGWVPMSKPIRFTEYGCPAIDRGTNQPNLFFDPASSESAVPRGSSGQRDDLIQMQYVRAFTAHWAEAAANPISPLYGGRMVDMDHAYLWAWDARPYPAFPLRGEVWTDGPNYQRGHWLNGRATAQPLEAVICEIVERAGLEMPDVGGMQGLLRGYALTETGTARSALQPLLLAGGVDALERAGRMRFLSRGARVAAVLDAAALVAGEAGDLIRRRAAEAEGTARLRLTHADAEGDYQRLVVEAKRPGEEAVSAMEQETPVALLPEEARRLAERWLSELRVGREVAEFTLPRSRIGLGVGDVVALEGQRWRIDRMEQGEALQVEAVRVERGVYLPGPDGGLQSRIAPFVPAVPVEPVFLDLPLMAGDEVAHAPHLAVAAAPWPGRVAVWSPGDGESFALNSVLGAAAVMGESQNALAAARGGLWDRGEPLVVRFAAGAVEARAEEAVLNGANLAAIGDGRADGWELFQFAGAELVGPQSWALTMRLRGQAGTEGAMPAFWPAGSRVVLMTGAVAQLSLPLSARGLERVWRVGAAARGVEDADVVERRLAFAGLGLRPYAVAHLRAEAVAGGVRLTWIRRTRIDGDSWESVEVPLGEEREAYLVEVRQGAAVLRRVEVTVAEWVYPAAWRAADGPVEVAVAQLSARFGAGPVRRIAL